MGGKSRRGTPLFGSNFCGRTTLITLFAHKYGIHVNINISIWAYMRDWWGTPIFGSQFYLFPLLL